jgi:acetyl-CoA acetyltransferase
MPPQPRGQGGDLEARLAVLEESLGAASTTGRAGRAVSGRAGGVRSLVERAASDPDFATELLASPREVAREFGLTREQGDAVALLSGQGLLASVLRSRGALPEAEGSSYY